MATLHEKLAASLEALHKLQSDKRHVFRSDEFTRVDRERLLEQGFLREVIKGWLISTSPGVTPGDTTPWFASFWEFCARYCEFRFGADWHLSPEQSLLLHAEDTVIPKQVIVYSPKGTNNTVSLMFGAEDLRSQKQDAARGGPYDEERASPVQARVRAYPNLRRFHEAPAVPRSTSRWRASGTPPRSRPPAGGRPYGHRGAPRRNFCAHRPQKRRRRYRQGDEGRGTRRST